MLNNMDCNDRGHSTKTQGSLKASQTKKETQPTNTFEDISNSSILKALNQLHMSMQAMVISAVKESLEELLSGEITSLKDMVEASNTSILKLSNSLGRHCGEMQVSNRAATDDIATCQDAWKNDFA
jgi:hypothetical protein